jgi:hypothetical protein
MIKAFGEGIPKLFENPKSLVIVVGGFLIAFGAAGGVTYNNFFPIPQLWQQVVVSVAGFLFAIAGVILVQREPTSSRPYGISITAPGRDADIRVTDVIGVFKKRFPTELYALWLLRIYPDDRYAPMREVRLPAEGTEWVVRELNMGDGKPGERRTIGAFLIGPSGQVIFKYWSEAVERHRRLVDAVEKHNAANDANKIPLDDYTRYLPSIKGQTTDMIECHRVDVRLS